MKKLKVIVQLFMPWLTRETLLTLWVKLFIKKSTTMSSPSDNASIYIAGLFHSHAGVASGAKAQLKKLQAEGRKVFGIDLTDAMKQSGTVEFTETIFDCKSLPDNNAPATVVIHQNPRWILIALHKLGKRFLKNKYIIGYWAWELEDIPEWWIDSINYVHEIWVPSDFVRKAIESHTDKPIKVIPHPPRFAFCKSRVFAEDGIIRVLYVFDFGSSYVRKNPIAAIKAFRLAFGDREDVEFIIKTSRHGMYLPGWLELKRETGGVKNIKLINTFLAQDELDDLYKKSDIYLSLHRSEGFGLTVFEAMNYGLHCVATGWSGNMGFMTEERCYPVKYNLIPVDDPQRIYPYPNSRWAEPNIEHATEILNQIAEHKKAQT